MKVRSRQPFVLCVGGDRPSSKRLESVLRAANFRVAVAATGKDALDLVQEEHPDLILLDEAVADMDGIDVLGRLRESKALVSIPVIFQSSSSDPKSTEESIAAGAKECLPKPVSEHDLLHKVRVHLADEARWRNLWQDHGSRQRRIVNVEFPLFRSFLLARIAGTPGVAKKVGLATVETLYSLAQDLQVTSRQMAQWIADFLSLTYIASVDPKLVNFEILPKSYCQANNFLVLEKADTQAFVLSNPFDWEVLDSLAELKCVERPFKTFVTEPENIALAFRKQKQREDEGPEESLPKIIEQLRHRHLAQERADQGAQVYAADTEPIVVLVNKLIEEAYHLDASDIHIEPFEDDITVRYRVDGYLRVVHRLIPRSLIRPIVSRIKIMSGLDISERRLPQDGRIDFKSFSDVDADFDLRVSTAPMHLGEKVVMRIVDKQKSVLPLAELGFSRRHLALYRERIRTPYGMILHVGPTGSGKSMTLYAALNEIRRPEINIVTAEDPIEYTVPGINQLQVRSDIGLTFGRALRCYLRQDPDVILLGEVRDLETAEIAIEASLTGHLLVSTLHTNDAPSTVTRLIQMGIAPYLVSSSIVLICAQRLLRRLCARCRRPYNANTGHKKLLGVPHDAQLELYKANGCATCLGIGYKGRIGVHELLVPNDTLRTAINKEGITAEALKRLAVDQCKTTTLYWDAMEKARQGITSIEEVLSKVRPDGFDSRPEWMLKEFGTGLSEERR